MITQVKFVSIPTFDEDRALAFYTGKLGFKLVSNQPFYEGQRWIELRIGNADTRFLPFMPPGQQERVGAMFAGALACDVV